MKKGFYLSTLLPILFLTGCSLDIDIVGQGTVSSQDQSIVCSEDCTKRSLSKLKQVTLSEQPASGFEFHGFVEEFIVPLFSVDEFRVAAAPLKVEYGREYMYLGDTQPYRWVSVRTKVTAIFLPIGSVQSEQQSFGSLCVINQDQSHECWGKSRSIVENIKDPISEFIAEVGDGHENDQWCAIVNSGLRCWNETSSVNWQVPTSISLPISVALVDDTACIVHHGNGAAELACFREDGVFLEGTPAIANPIRVWSNEGGDFCTDNSGESICWNFPNAVSLKQNSSTFGT